MKSIDYGCLEVGEGVRMEGDISVPVNASITGEVKGSLTAQTITIDPQARIEGKATAQTIDVSGALQGEVHASDILMVRAQGFVGGKIAHGELQIDRGGQLEGTVECLKKKSFP